MDNDALFAIAIPDLKREEGLRFAAYPDPISGGEPYTIGYGHTGPGVRLGLRWTLQQAEAALLADAERACRALDAALPWWRSLDLPRQAVMLDMAFNMGVGKLEGFVHTLDYVRAGKWPEAAAGMEASAWARQVGDRAKRLAQQMRTGVHVP